MWEIRAEQQSAATAVTCRADRLPPPLPCSLQVGYCSELALQGGTPSYLLPLLTFNHLQQLWQEAVPVLSVEGLHDHVVTLHQRFLQGLDAAGHPTINSRTLLPPQVCVQTVAAAMAVGMPGVAAALKLNSI